VVNAQEKPVEKLEYGEPPPSFNVYFPNDVYDVDKYPLYENGLQNPLTDPILYKDNVTGANFGLSAYTEMCYQFNVNGRKTWSSIQCSETAGVTQGSAGRLEPDRTNFGLNATGTTASYAGTKLGDKKYPSFRDQQYGKDLQNYLLTKCKNCKVEVVGYASTVGTFGDNRNDELSKLRSESVKAWLIKNIITDPPFVERVSIVAEGKGATEGGGGSCPSPNVIARKKNYLKSKNDLYGCKVNRYVTVRFVVDPNLKTKEESKTEKPPETVTPPKIITPPIPRSRFYSECDYFEKLSLSDPFAYKSIKEKIKYFQPAFHSTTPEGFNARLNFLQQCMRQGPTLGANGNNNPNNLAFCRPPVCILRIGDFYNTKIIIENLNFTFEPLVWDLNPEGVGVQPMICNVDLSFAFIGGSSLRGPINRLQNAVSFNYYANTEVYDPRPDTIEINKDGGKVVNGVSGITTQYNILPNASDITGLSPNTTRDVNQVVQNDNANSGDATQPITPAETIDDSAVINCFGYEGTYMIDESDPTDIQLVMVLYWNAKNDVKNPELNKSHKAFIYVQGSGREKVIIGHIKISPNSAGSLIFDASDDENGTPSGTGRDQILSFSGNQNKTRINFQVEFYIDDATKAKFVLDAWNSKDNKKGPSMIQIAWQEENGASINAGFLKSYALPFPNQT